MSFLDEMLRMDNTLRVEEIQVPKLFAGTTLGELGMRRAEYVLLIAFHSAMATASVSSRQRSTDSTGPKISSRASRIDMFTSVKTVGSIQKPFLSLTHKLVT